MHDHATCRAAASRAGKALPAFATLALALAPALASAADTCPIPIDDVKAAIEAFSSKVASEDSGTGKDFSSAMSSHADKYFARWDDLNKAAGDATKFVTKGYDLAKFTGALPEDKVQTATTASQSPYGVSGVSDVTGCSGASGRTTPIRIRNFPAVSNSSRGTTLVRRCNCSRADNKSTAATVMETATHGGCASAIGPIA